MSSITNLETDPHCLNQRESWRSTVEKQDNGLYRYGLKAGETNFTVQLSTGLLPEGGIVVADYLASGGAKASVQYSFAYDIVSDNGRLLVIKAFRNDSCAPLYTQGEIVLRHVTVLPNEDEYKRMLDTVGMQGFDSATRPLIFGA